jgi:uncharacterized linocin/CFP29 family protein
MTNHSTTATLTDEEVEYIESAIIEEQLEAVIGRNVIGVTPVDPGTLTYTYNKLTNMSAAEVVAEMGEFPYDNVSRTPTSAYIEKLGKGFQLSREAILAARKGGYDINTYNARSAVRQVAELEEYKIFTTFESNATTDYVANSDGDGGWGEAGATPLEDIINVRTVLRNYNYRLTDVLIKPDYYKYLMIPNTYGITPLSEIQAIGINVTETANIASGSDAIAMDASQATLVVAEDVATEGDYVLSNQSWNNQVFERVVPVMYDNDAFVKMDLATTT